MSAANAPDPSRLELLHEAALHSLYALVQFYDLVVRLPADQRNFLHADQLYRAYLVPLFEAQGKLASIPEPGSSFKLMTTARLALGRDLLKLHDMPTASAHELTLGAPWFLIRLWNQQARPGALEIPPPVSGTWQMVLYPPREGMALEFFLDAAQKYFHDFKPLPIQAELKLEYAKATEMLRMDQPLAEYRVQCVGDIWHLRHRSEFGTYSVRGNQSIRWLAKLLAAPNRALTVADLRGDPNGKLTADAMLGDETETDLEGTMAIKRRLREIDDITAETGGSESLTEERARLLARLQRTPWARKVDSQLRRDHKNIATQLRGLRRKLMDEMPQLAAHLKASLKLNFPHFGYYPPDPSPRWEF